MSPMQNDLQRLVEDFVSQVTEIARRTAMNALESALGKNGAAGKNGATANREPRRARVKSQVMRSARSRGGKRTPEELDKLQSEFLAFVVKNPGLRIEQINAQLGTTTKDLALPIRKLIAHGSLKVKGTKRSTSYFPGKAKD